MSRPRGSLFSMKGHKLAASVSDSEQKRPLLLPQEVKELGRDRELLLYEGLRPILAKKNRYFEDPILQEAALFAAAARDAGGASARAKLNRPMQASAPMP